MTQYLYRKLSSVVGAPVISRGPGDPSLTALLEKMEKVPYAIDCEWTLRDMRNACYRLEELCGCPSCSTLARYADQFVTALVTSRGFQGDGMSNEVANSHPVVQHMQEVALSVMVSTAAGTRLLDTCPKVEGKCRRATIYNTVAASENGAPTEDDEE